MATVVDCAHLDLGKLEKVQAAADFIAGHVSLKYSKNLDAATFFAIKGGNARDSQPGLCYNWQTMKSAVKVFRGPEASKLGVTGQYQTGISVMLNVEKPDSGGTLWPPTIFHECGHAMFDPVTGGGESHAWLVELEMGLAWAEAKDGMAAFKTFVQSRKSSSQYLPSAYRKYPEELKRVEEIVGKYGT